MFQLLIHIFILSMLAFNIGKIVEKKGRKKIGYQIMVIGMWLGGEVLGVIIGVMLGVIVGMYDVQELAIFGSLLIFFLKWGGAVSAAMFAFQIAYKLPSAEADKFYRGIDYADRLGASEHFRDRAAIVPPAADPYTDGSEQVSRPVDERIQE